jgi:hypothetical protein
MPAAIMSARPRRSAVAVTFEQRRQHGRWRRSCTGSSPLEFTAPNLQYLMDSPSEFVPSPPPVTVGSRTFGFAAPHGDRRRLDGFLKGREDRPAGRPIYGEFPEYEPGRTFLADYLPCASGDGAEHRNSTVIVRRFDCLVARGPARYGRARVLPAGTSSAFVQGGWSRSISIARICPASSGWPKGSRSTRTAGDGAHPCGRRVERQTFTSLIETVAEGSALVRSAEEEPAPFIDGGRSSIAPTGRRR